MIGGFAPWQPLGPMVPVLRKGAPLFSLHLTGPWWSVCGSGNCAFDEHREAALRQLEEARRALDEQPREIGVLLAQSKPARRREEFARVMSGRGAGAA